MPWIKGRWIAMELTRTPKYEYTTGEVSAAGRYLVIALHHVSEAATKARRYRRAYFCLVATVEMAEGIKEASPGWSDFVSQLKKQLRQAKSRLENRPSND